MSEQRLQGKRVLVTQAKDYMGPATIELFREHGAEVIADDSDLTQPGAAQGVVGELVFEGELRARAFIGRKRHDLPTPFLELRARSKGVRVGQHVELPEALGLVQPGLSQLVFGGHSLVPSGVALFLLLLLHIFFLSLLTY